MKVTGDYQMPIERYKTICFDDEQERYYEADVEDYDCVTYQCQDDYTKITFSRWLTDAEVEKIQEQKRQERERKQREALDYQWSILKPYVNEPEFDLAIVSTWTVQQLKEFCRPYTRFKVSSYRKPKLQELVSRLIKQHNESIAKAKQFLIDNPSYNQEN